MRNAKKSGNPLEVKEMSTEDFYDIKSLYEDISPNFSKNTDGQEFKVSEVKLMQFEKGSNEFKYKTSYKQDHWFSIDIQPKKRRSLDIATKIKNINLKRAYTKKIVLADNKKRDLKCLLMNNLIPQFYKYFYDSVCT